MRRFLLFISLILISASSFGQWLLYDNYILNFDDTIGIQHITIDTVSNPNNIWQIGTPQKTVFTSASSSPNAMITDTVNSYPTNDTSVFILTNIAYGGGFHFYHTVSLNGLYFVNSDTLTDYGTIEFSPDNSTTWIDLLNDTTYAHYISWGYPNPTFTGNSNGWTNFYFNIAGLGNFFNVEDGDTTLYRITFISDSVQTNKDGLMFDDLYFSDYYEGIEEIRNDNLIAIYPNPTKEKLYIKTDKFSGTQAIQIVNYQCQLLYDNRNFTGNFIDIEQLKNGVYFLKYSNNKAFAVKKFLVNH